MYRKLYAERTEIIELLRETRPVADGVGTIRQKIRILGPAAGAWVLDQIGETYEVPMSDGSKTLSCIVKYYKLNKFLKTINLDLNTIFKDCGGTYKFYPENDIKNGYLVNLDFYQETALLRAIAEKFPELKNDIGFYNLKASRKVFEVLNKIGLHTLKDLNRFYTGEIWESGKTEDDYPSEELIFINKLSKKILESNRCFCFRVIYHDSWDRINLSEGSDRPVILGTHLPVHSSKNEGE